MYLFCTYLVPILYLFCTYLEEDLKKENNLKNEYDLKNEDNLKKENDLKSEDDLKMKISSSMKMTSTMMKRLKMETLTDNATGCPTKNLPFCQTLGLVLRLRVDFVLPLSQQEQQPLTKIYQKGVY